MTGSPEKKRKGDYGEHEKNVSCMAYTLALAYQRQQRCNEGRECDTKEQGNIRKGRVAEKIQNGVIVVHLKRHKVARRILAGQYGHSVEKFDVQQCDKTHVGEDLQCRQEAFESVFHR